MVVTKLTTEEFCQLGPEAPRGAIWEHRCSAAEIALNVSRETGIGAAVVIPANDLVDPDGYKTFVALVGCPERGAEYLEALEDSWNCTRGVFDQLTLGNERVAIITDDPGAAEGRRETQIRVTSEVFGSYEELAERIGGVVVGANGAVYANRFALALVRRDPGLDSWLKDADVGELERRVFAPELLEFGLPGGSEAKLRCPRAGPWALPYPLERSGLQPCGGWRYCAPLLDPAATVWPLAPGGLDGGGPEFNEDAVASALTYCRGHLCPAAAEWSDRWFDCGPGRSAQLLEEAVSALEPVWRANAGRVHFKFRRASG